MNKLMKMATIVAGVGAMLNFAGCGSKGPDQVALDVLKTLQEGKADPAFLEKNCTKETAGVFTMFGDMVKDATKGATWTATQTYIDDDVATVMIKQDGGKNPGEEAYYLKKIDGQWKLHVDKKHPGEDCIGTKTRNDAVKFFEILLTKFDETEIAKYCTSEFVAELKKRFASGAKDKDQAAAFAAMKKTIKVTGSEINKHDPNEGTISISANDGKRDQDLGVELKRVNGIWKICGFSH